jgi:hypothetical protein
LSRLSFGAIYIKGVKGECPHEFVGDDYGASEVIIIELNDFE